MQVPTQDQINGQLRIIIPALGTILGAVGVASTQVNYWVGIAMASSGAVAYLVAAVWSWHANSRASIMASAAKPVDAMTPAPQIVLPQQEAALAKALPENVTTTLEAKVVKQ